LEPSQQQIPPDAQRSPDGNYWLDTTINDWRPVPGSAADTGAAAATAAAGAAAGGQGQKTGTATQQGAVRPEDKMPISELSLEVADTAEVPAIEGSEGTEHAGEGLA
jgi:hypothetical protein